MHTHCTQQKLTFQGLGRRKVEGKFDAGRVSSDGGALLLRELEERVGIINRFAACFSDHRDPELIEHTVEELLRQRIFGLCLGYEDLNDHATLRDDAVLAVAVGKRDPTGTNRPRQRDKNHPLASPSTLDRLELTPLDAGPDARYKKIVGENDLIERFFVQDFIDAHKTLAMSRIVLDIDPSDIELHGNQEGRHFHGYYDHYCYLPLFIFCGQHLLVAKQRESNIDGCAGTVEELDWVVRALRAKWPKAEIVVRADSGFARESIMSWCEANNVHYIIGLARNPRLAAKTSKQMARARLEAERTTEPARVYADFTYRTLETWSRARRVVAKAEYLPGKENPRYVVTSYSTERISSTALYEDEYCGRGEMENRIKEHQLDLFGDRASSTKMRGNQLRLWFSAVAYLLMVELRRSGLVGTPLAKAQTNTIRVRLFKLGVLVRISVRRVRLAFSSVFPLQALFETVLTNIKTRWALPPPATRPRY